MNQTYHLIPEPAGDWQEGDIQLSDPSLINQYRARPVKAQAGQLWRDKIIQEFADFLPIRLGGLPDSDVAEVTKIAAEVLADVLAVSAQACACEGLRTALRRMLDTSVEMATEHATEAHLFARRDAVHALAQPCPVQSSGEQPISEKGGAERTWDELQEHNKRMGIPNPSAASSEAQEWRRGGCCILYGSSMSNVVYDDVAATLVDAHNSTVEALRRELAESKASVATVRELRDFEHDQIQFLRAQLDEAEADRDQWRNTAKGWETEVTMWAARCSRFVKQEQIYGTHEELAADRNRWRDRAKHWEEIKRVEWQP